MRDTRGAVVFARKTIESEIFSIKPDKWFKIWIFLLVTANYKDNGKFNKGECFTTYAEMCSYTKATRNEVDHCIRWLKSAKQITTRKATRGLFINIVNYNVYQKLDTYKSDTKSDTKSDLKAIEERHRGDTKKKKEKKEKKDKNIPEVTSGDKFSSEGADLIKSFEAINPACGRMYSNTTQRQACEDLIKTYTFERVKSVIENTLQKTNALQFFPTITTPVQLRDKWTSLESSVHKYQSDKKANINKNKVAFK